MMCFQGSEIDLAPPHRANSPRPLPSPRIAPKLWPIQQSVNDRE